MINCPICHFKIADEPSPEYRGQIDNLYQGAPPTDYYFYRKDDKKQRDENTLDKSKKNFPGNKSTYPQLETPEDQSTVANLKNNFIYAVCKKCGHRIIQLGEEITEKIQEIKPLENGIYEIMVSYPKTKYNQTFKVEKKQYFPHKDIEGKNTKEIIDLVKYDYPSFLEPILNAYVKMVEDGKYSYVEDVMNEFNDDIYNNRYNEEDVREEIFSYYESSFLETILWEKIKNIVFQLDKKEIDEYFKEKWESDLDYFDYDVSWYNEKSLDEVVDEINSNPSEDYFMEKGINIIKYDYRESKYRGNLDFPEKDIDIMGTDYYKYDEENELKEYYFDKLIDFMSDTYGYDIGSNIIQIYYNKIIEALQEKEDEDFYVDTPNGRTAVFPTENVKKFMIDPSITQYIYDEGLSVEELQNIPVYNEELEEKLQNQQKPQYPDQLSFFDLEKQSNKNMILKQQLENIFLRQAIQPDIRQDNPVDHENDPIDKNNPSNQHPSMGDDFDRIKSSVDIEDLENKYRKNKGKIPFRKEILT